MLNFIVICNLQQIFKCTLPTEFHELSIIKAIAPFSSISEGSCIDDSVSLKTISKYTIDEYFKRVFEYLVCFKIYINDLIKYFANINASLEKYLLEGDSSSKLDSLCNMFLINNQSKRTAIFLNNKDNQEFPKFKLMDTKQKIEMLHLLHTIQTYLYVYSKNTPILLSESLKHFDISLKTARDVTGFYNIINEIIHDSTEYLIKFKSAINIKRASKAENIGKEELENSFKRLKQYLVVCGSTIDSYNNLMTVYQKLIITGIETIKMESFSVSFIDNKNVKSAISEFDDILNSFDEDFKGFPDSDFLFIVKNILHEKSSFFIENFFSYIMFTRFSFHLDILFIKIYKIKNDEIEQKSENAFLTTIKQLDMINKHLIYMYEPSRLYKHANYFAQKDIFNQFFTLTARLFKLREYLAI